MKYKAGGGAAAEKSQAEEDADEANDSEHDNVQEIEASPVENAEPSEKPVPNHSPSSDSNTQVSVSEKEDAEVEDEAEGGTWEELADDYDPSDAGYEGSVGDGACEKEATGSSASSFSNVPSQSNSANGPVDSVCNGHVPESPANGDCPAPEEAAVAGVGSDDGVSTSCNESAEGKDSDKPEDDDSFALFDDTDEKKNSMPETLVSSGDSGCATDHSASTPTSSNSSSSCDYRTVNSSNSSSGDQQVTDTSAKRSQSRSDLSIPAEDTCSVVTNDSVLNNAQDTCKSCAGQDVEISSSSSSTSTCNAAESGSVASTTALLSESTEEVKDSTESVPASSPSHPDVPAAKEPAENAPCSAPRTLQQKAHQLDGFGTVTALRVNDWSLEGCLRRYIQPELLDGANRFRCEECTLRRAREAGVSGKVSE